jgi:hypothetical protein
VEREIELRVGGKRIGLNAFSREILAGVVVGLVTPLKGVDTAQEIVLRVGAAEAGGSQERD